MSNANPLLSDKSIIKFVEYIYPSDEQSGFDVFINGTLISSVEFPEQAIEDILRYFGINAEIIWESAPFNIKSNTNSNAPQSF